jgi:hypothetical protein
MIARPPVAPGPPRGRAAGDFGSHVPDIGVTAAMHVLLHRTLHMTARNNAISGGSHRGRNSFKCVGPVSVRNAKIRNETFSGARKNAI